MVSLRHLGIRAHLFGAFGSVAAMTIAATTVAWISFGGLGDRLNRIVTKDLPTVTLAASLAEKGGAITATAPNLAAAANKQERKRALLLLSKNIKEMRNLLRPSGGSTDEADENRKIHALIDSLAANLRDLDANVLRRFRYREQNQKLVNRLRWAHADFLQEVEPMINDAKFKIGLAIERSNGEQASIPGRGKQRLQLELSRQAALFRINAAGNLAVGLMARAASLSEIEDLKDTSLFLSEIQGRLEADLKSVKGLPEALSLLQSLQDLMTFSKGQHDLFALRRDELKTLADGRKLVALNRGVVGKLQHVINQRVAAGNAASLAAARQSAASIERGKALLLIVAGISIAVAVLVVWLYVGRNLVRRIRLLDQSMRAIADGDLKSPVPTGGTDEISEMATALGTFRDTLVQTQAELVQAGKLAALGQLSAGVAHELNQPLAAIRNYVHNSARFIENGNIAEAERNLKRISGLVERMSGTVNHLRTLARRPSSQLEKIDLADTAEQALRLLGNRLSGEHIRVGLNLSNGEWFVKAEAIRLEQVLINLFGNAIDSMVGQDDGRLSIAATRDRDKVTLLIRDTGCGIPEDQLDKVFEPFFTTKEIGEGLGLGLAISYNIIKDFGGSVRVNSTLDKGSVFTIVLDAA